MRPHADEFVLARPHADVIVLARPDPDKQAQRKVSCMRGCGADMALCAAVAGGLWV